MRKRGNIVTENAIGLILAIAATIALILLMIGLYDPTFNEGEEGAESYLKGLERAIDEVDESGRSDFFMLDLGREGLEFYLVYFGEALSFVKDEKAFVRSPRDGSLCVCYKQGERVSCKDCVKIKGEVVYGESAPWIIGEGERVSINERGDDYVFVRE